MQGTDGRADTQDMNTQLGKRQGQMLRIIYDDPGQSGQHIIWEAGTSPRNGYQVLERLQRRGFVRCDRVTANRNAWHITEAGIWALCDWEETPTVDALQTSTGDEL